MLQINKNRLLSLDVLRGASVAGMIFVNNPGDEHTYSLLLHADWIGLTLADLVFPFFVFIMGISIAFSLKGYNYTFSYTLCKKIVSRAIILYLIGVALSYISHFFGRLSSPLAEGNSYTQHLWYSIQAWENTFKLGVMQRLGICYVVVAFLALFIRHRYFPYTLITILIGYAVLLLVGNGYVYGPTNVLSIVDRAILGVEHMPTIHHGIQPEGILSSIPAIAHTMLGFCVGKMLLQQKEIEWRIKILSLLGTGLIFVGFLLSFFLPLCKKNWSPSFVLVTCGLASFLLGILTWVIDKKGYKNWCLFFHVFGVNPLFIYVLAALGATLLYVFKLNFGGIFLCISDFIVNVLLSPITNLYIRSLIYAFSFVFLNWLFGYWLYKNKIFIKI